MSNWGVPTEFFEGAWHFPRADGPEPQALVTYVTKTGSWVWWALGKMGDEPTYTAARTAAVAELARRNVGRASDE